MSAARALMAAALAAVSKPGKAKKRESSILNEAARRQKRMTLARKTDMKREKYAGSDRK
jgi:hypothetical protein